MWLFSSTLLPVICWAFLLYLGWGPWYSDKTKNLVRTAAYTSEITTLSRGNHRTYRLSFRRYEPGYGRADQTAFLFVHGHLGSYRQGLNLAEWSTTNRTVWYTVDFAPASLAACSACEIQAQADYVVFVLVTLKKRHRRVVVVAHSMGGIVGDFALAALGSDDISVHINVPWSWSHPIFIHPAMASYGEGTNTGVNRRRLSFSSGLRDNIVPTVFTEPGTLELSRVRNVYESYTHINVLFSRPFLSMFKEQVLPLVLEDREHSSSNVIDARRLLTEGLGQRVHAEADLIRVGAEATLIDVNQIKRVGPGVSTFRVEGVHDYWQLTVVCVVPKTQLPVDEIEAGSAGDDFSTADLIVPQLSVYIGGVQGDSVSVPCDYIAHPQRVTLCMASPSEYGGEVAISNGKLIVHIDSDSTLLVIVSNARRKRVNSGVLSGELIVVDEVICSLRQSPFPLKIREVRGLVVIPSGDDYPHINDDLLVVRTPDDDVYSSPIRLPFSVDWQQVVVTTVRGHTSSAIAIFLVALRFHRSRSGLLLAMLVLMLRIVYSCREPWQVVPELLLLVVSAAAGVSLSSALSKKTRVVSRRLLLLLALSTPVAPPLAILLSAFCHMYAGNTDWAISSVLVSYQSILCYVAHMWYAPDEAISITMDLHSALDNVMALTSISILWRGPGIASVVVMSSLFIPIIVMVSTIHISCLWWGVLTLGVVETLCG